MARIFPPDLVQAQSDWIRTYEALARTPFRTVLRRRLQLLSCRIAQHPYWSGGACRSSAAHTELRRQARAALQRKRKSRAA
ncbi:hypothetical protein AB0451_34800 [Streptomyces sp. NPDC052000]|uniref:hypothetical protein n=1 Tax=Streptomyces sp. NPDC052000 TaxID=3155676 RepID=UPI00344F0248